MSTIRFSKPLGRRATAAALCALILAGIVPQAQSRPELALKAAMDKEVIDGDAKGAIEAYKKVVETAGTNRPVAARALVRLAELYTKLGDPQDKGIYEQLVRDYGDQPEAVKLARTRLAKANAPAKMTGDRIVKAAAPDVTDGDGRVSPDGRFISYVEYRTGYLNLMLHDLVAGTNRALTGLKDWDTGAAYSSTFSPDGKQVAYGWRTYGLPHTNEIRLVSVNGTGVPPSRRVYSHEDIDFFHPTDWSPDGTTLAVGVVGKDRTSRIALVGVHDGSLRSLKTVGWRGPGKIFFSPDGKHVAYDLPSSDTAAERDVFITATDASADVRAVDDPADDVVMGWSPDGRHLLFASNRNRDLGLWALPVSNGKPQGAPKLLKPDIGSVQFRQSWGWSQGLTTSGALHIVKDASTVSLQVAPIDLESGKLTGPAVLQVFRNELPDWSPDGRQLAYVSRGISGIASIAIRSLDSGQVRELRPPLSYMPLPRWFPDGRSLVVGGRDLKGRGVIQQIDVQTGRETLITENTDPMEVQVSPDGKKIYYARRASVESRHVTVVERDLSSGEVTELFRKPEGSQAQKLSPDGRLFSLVVNDRRTQTSALTIVPVAGGEARTVFTQSSPAQLNGYRGNAWTPDSKAVLIVSATNEFLDPALWLVPVNGDRPRKLDIDVSSWIAGAGIRLHPDGKQIAYFTGEDSREVWALDSILSALNPKK
jgi:Tol biopolymer transport system component